jgi:hypothetical protein
MMLLPLAYLVAARLYRGRTAEAPLGWVAQVATAMVMGSKVQAGHRPALTLREPSAA